MVGLVLVDYVVAVAVQKCAATSPTDAASVITADLCTKDRELPVVDVLPRLAGGDHHLRTVVDHLLHTVVDHPLPTDDDHDLPHDDALHLHTVDVLPHVGIGLAIAADLDPAAEGDSRFVQHGACGR